MNDGAEQERRLIADYHTVFETPAGERVKEDLGKHCFEYRTTQCAPGGATDIYATCMNEGARTVMVYIDTMLARRLEDVEGTETAINVEENDDA
jgi:hypothetical protein